MRELPDLELEKVAGGKELRDALERTAGEWGEAARDVRRTSRTVSDKVERLAKTLGVE